MNKPKKKTIEYFDYFECFKYIEEKYGIKEHNFEEAEKNPDIEFHSFWSWLLDTTALQNGAVFVLDKTFLDGAPEFAKSPLKALLDEFGEGEFQDCWFIAER